MKNKKILNILCVALVMGNIYPAMATEQSYMYTENDEPDTKITQVIYDNGIGDYFVRIPKLITLGKEKTCSYSVEVNGDISSDKQVYVSPIDSLKDTDNFDFYMVDQSSVSQKTNVVATVSQNKFYWNFEEARDGYIETENSISALSLSAGTWRGTFDFEINMHDTFNKAPEKAIDNWNATFDEENKTVTLNYYTGSETDVIVYDAYVVNGEVYKTEIMDSPCAHSGYASYMFNNWGETNSQNIKSIIFSKDIDTSKLTSMTEMFNGCSSLKYLDISHFDTSNVTDMAWMFKDCSSLTDLDLSNFNTSKVYEMAEMFNGCRSLVNLNVSTFDTSNVQDFRTMFQYCSSLTSLDLTSFDTHNAIFTADKNPNITGIGAMFYGCTNLKTIYVSKDKWSTSAYAYNYAFSNCGTSSVTYK